MGYPNKALKRRRHNRNLSLHARVSLAGVQIIATPVMPRRRNFSARRRYTHAFKAVSTHGHTSSYYRNCVTLMEKVEAYLQRGLEKW